MRPRALALTALLAVLAGLGASCAAPSEALRPSPQRTIEVTLVGLFSGPGGSAGRDLRNSLELEAAALNAGGGLLGARVEIVTADGAGDAARAAELVRQQVGGAGVGLVVGPDTTAGFRAARGALDRSAVPNCLTAVADDALRGARTAFLVGPANGAEVAALLAAVRRARPDAQRIGLLDAGDDLGGSYDALLAAQAPGAGLRYVGRLAAGADAGAALQQLAGQGAQVVVLSQPPAGAARAALAAAQLPAPGRPLLAGFATLADGGIPTLAGDAAAGALLVATPQAYLTSAPQATWPAGYRAFVGAAGQQYGLGGGGSRLQAAPAGADCLLQWAHAVRSAGTFTGAAVARAWEHLDLPAAETALGVRERLSQADHTAVAQSSLVTYTWTREGGRYQLKPV
jgi:branched-chain amino acid transport system substrate-binding protein